MKLAEKYLKEGKKYIVENKLDLAAMSIQSALIIYERENDYEQVAYCYNMIGAIHSISANVQMALDRYISGLQLAKKYNLKNIISLFYNNIGSIYLDLEEYQKAIAYFEKSAEALQYEECRYESAYYKRTLITYLNMCSAYYYLGKYSEASKYLELSEELLSVEGNEFFHASILIYRCLIQWMEGDREFVYSCMEDLIKASYDTESITEYMHDMRRLCSLFQRMNEFEAWKRVIENVSRYVDKQPSVYFKIQLTELWIEYFEIKGDYEKFSEACVTYMKLNRERKKLYLKEEVDTIEIKLLLKEKEEQIDKGLGTNIDFLTKLGNRYEMDNDLTELFKNNIIDNVGIGVLDIDCFKMQNDTYGHLAGDDCLIQVSKTIASVLGGQGRAYRYGGDEFVILLLDVDTTRLENIGRRINKKIEALQIPNKHSYNGILTVSIGFAYGFPKKMKDVSTMIETADKAMYNVKEMGGNGTIVHNMEFNF